MDYQTDVKKDEISRFGDLTMRVIINVTKIGLFSKVVWRRVRNIWNLARSIVDITGIVPHPPYL